MIDLTYKINKTEEAQTDQHNLIKTTWYEDLNIILFNLTTTIKRKTHE